MKVLQKQAVDTLHQLILTLIDIFEYQDTTVQVNKLLEEFRACLEVIRDDLDTGKSDREVAEGIKALLHNTRVQTVLAYKKEDGKC